jgi:uncharacterized protein (TIGR00369 family)
MKELQKIRKPQFETCFVCGPQSNGGLHVDVQEGDGYARGTWTVLPQYVGYENVLHGGIQASILDDVISHATYSLNVGVVTAHLEVDYRTPAHVGDELVCEAWVVSRGKRSIRLAKLLRGDTVISEAKCVMVSINPETL